MAFILENTLRKPVLLVVDGKTQQIKARGSLVAALRPLSVPRGVIVTAGGVLPEAPAAPVEPQPEPTPDGSANEAPASRRTKKPKDPSPSNEPSAPDQPAPATTQE